MSDEAPTAWRGQWVEREPTDPDVVLAVADRRGVEPSAVEAELAAVAERFDVDAVYLTDTDA